MEIEKSKGVMVNAKVMRIALIVLNGFTYGLHDDDDEFIFMQINGPVPEFMPGEHHGENVYLDIDIDTGRILNWIPPTSDQLQQAIK